MIIKRGDIFYADLNPVVGSEQGGIRPVLVVQNNTGNTYSPTVIVIPFSTAKKKKLPVHINVQEIKSMLSSSVALAEQIRTIDRKLIIKYIGSLDNEIMKPIDKALKISLGVNI